MKLALISDAWHPQINGVVTTLSNTCRALQAQGDTVELVTPDRFRTWPCPSYPSIRLALGCGPKVRALLDAFHPDRIHIATEGPLGLAARRYCLDRGLAFTTSFHTLFPEYINLRVGLPVRWGYAYLRWFHAPATRVMVATQGIEEALRRRGFSRLARWSRGVDTTLYRPGPKNVIVDPRPVFLFAGRVAVEKNIEAFLRLDLPGTKYVVGDGPHRAALEAKYPDVRFVGFKTGYALAEYLAAADVFVFPSLTDTFGIVMLDALACGVPVAAYPVPGPKDVLTDPRVGSMDEDLRKAALKALALNGEDCRLFALNYAWSTCSRQFADNLTPARPDATSRQLSFEPPA